MNIWHMASGIVSLLCAIALSLVILHPRIHEGIVIKTGLITMVISCLVTFALTMADSTDWGAYWRASFWLRAGLLLTCAGLVMKARTVAPRRQCVDEMLTRSWMRRMTEPVNDLAHLFSDQREKTK